MTRSSAATGFRGKVGLLILSTLLSLLAAEGVLRLMPPAKEFRVGTTRTEKARLYGWAPEPNSNNRVLSPDTWEIRYDRMNSQGWKDVEHSFEKPAGMIRILFVGDSYTYGQVPLPELYTRQVEKKLNERGIGNVELISIGVGSWGTDQELEVLKNEGVRYHPDVVIYQFCDNDLDDNMMPREGMVVTNLTGIFLRKPFRYEVRDGVLTRIELEPPVAFSRRVKDFLLKSAVIHRLNLLRWRIKRRRLPAPEDTSWWVGSSINPNGAYKPDDGTPHREEEWELLEGLLLEMRSVARGAGAEFVVFSESGDEGGRLWQIEKGRIHTDGVTDYVHWEGKKHPVDTRRPLKDLTRLCARHEIPLIRPQRVYERYHGDNHTNACGNEMMAEDIVDFLIAWPVFQRLVSGAGGP